MAFIDSELSAHGGQPFQLYEFVRSSGGADFFWRYCGADRDVSYGGFIYTAVPISDSGARFSSEAVSTDFTVTMPITEDFPQSFRLGGVVSSDSVFLRVRRVHAADVTDIDTNPVVTDARVVWVGTVSGVRQTDEITAQITCAMLSASFQRGGLRYGYQRSCPHVLYAPLTCRVDRESFRIDGTVTTVDGVTVGVDTAASKPDGWFNGGFIEYTQEPAGFTERRFVTLHVGANLILMTEPIGLSVSDTVAMFPGCNRTTSDCIDKFNNLDNYGGFPHLPGRNPFDGLPVF